MLPSLPPTWTHSFPIPPFWVGLNYSWPEKESGLHSPEGQECLVETFRHRPRQPIKTQCKKKKKKDFFPPSALFECKDRSVKVNMFFHFPCYVTHQEQTCPRAKSLRQGKRKGAHTSQVTPSVSVGNWKNIREGRSTIKKLS